MMEILFIDVETGHVNYAVTDVTRIRYITPSEVGFDKGFNENARTSSCSFLHTEKLEIQHTTRNPYRNALLQMLREPPTTELRVDAA